MNLTPAPSDPALTARREIGVVTGRLFSPPWLLARARRAERLAARNADATGNGTLLPPGQPLTQKLIFPAGLTFTP